MAIGNAHVPELTVLPPSMSIRRVQKRTIGPKSKTSNAPSETVLNLKEHQIENYQRPHEDDRDR